VLYHQVDHKKETRVKYRKQTRGRGASIDQKPISGEEEKGLRANKKMIRGAAYTSESGKTIPSGGGGGGGGGCMGGKETEEVEHIKPTQWEGKPDSFAALSPLKKRKKKPNSPAKSRYIALGESGRVQYVY